MLSVNIYICICMYIYNVLLYTPATFFCFIYIHMYGQKIRIFIGAFIVLIATFFCKLYQLISNVIIYLYTQGMILDVTINLTF